ncbi:toxin-antitoxin system YwqK family antitoxin [Flavobacterium endoglycinae]|uniref:Toxin-antitoxin system YwqK family antitoxin n=1 Tax=Flavobacterium endoglycinae TaxID=2816357 RepID=A0ABX7QH42_9FLAO|nr:toxin-antitoxin system YwqK family antitoxin [Flavobacterium endoglycinae]QSW89954.1 toxin-antitoxin system YwqK family antitoxin [Flavobacterium endoglycinae]
MTKKLALLLLILIYGCNADINDRDKRNENWVYWLDSKTGKSSWIPVSDQTTVKDGKYISFYSEGTIYEKGKLKNGKNIDTIYWYDQNEKLIHYALVKSGKFIQYYVNDGPYISYFQDGKVFEKGIVKNHKIKDQWTRYFNNGNIEWSIDFKDGTGLKTWYFEDGQISAKTAYIKNKLSGQNKHWFENGQVKEISYWTNGMQTGLFECYFENGKLEQRTNWKNDEPEGLSERWYNNGQKKNIQFFKGGLIDGNGKQWHPNGKLQVDLNYISGKKNGKALKYHENGNLQVEGNYKNDEQDGVWKWYDENGKFIQKDIYVNGKLIEIQNNL